MKKYSVFVIFLSLIATFFLFQNASVVDANIRSSMVEKVITGPARSYFAYPHANGFFSTKGTANTIIYSQPLYTAEGYQYTNIGEYNLATGANTVLTHFRNAGAPYFLYYVSSNGKLVYRDGSLNSLRLVDLKKIGTPTTLYAVNDSSKRVSDAMDISSDGSEVLFSVSNTTTLYSNMYKINTQSKAITTLDSTSWQLNHTHFSPFEPKSKINFCHEGDTTKTLDRMWGWENNNAKQLFNQIGTDGKYLNVGHERSLFHKAGALAVAYSNSASSDTGLYEIDFNGNSKLVSYGPNDWHTNVSRDGTIAVVDTQGTFTTTSTGTYASSNIVLINYATGEREVLYTTTTAINHPYHPHPHISPDKQWIIFNDAVSKRFKAIKLNTAKLNAFINKRNNGLSRFSITSGSSVESNGVRLSLQTNGNLIARNAAGKHLWESGTSADCTNQNCHLSLQGDGNLVIYRGSTAIWNTGTTRDNASTKMNFSTTEPYLTLTNNKNSIVWASSYNFTVLKLVGGQFIRIKIPNQEEHYLRYQGDGNLVMYNSKKVAMWNTHTGSINCGSACLAVFQNSDRNFVLYNGKQDASKAYWTSHTSRTGNYLQLTPASPYFKVVLK